MKNLLVYLISFIFGRYSIFGLNLILYKLTLYGIGYNNYLKNKTINGELKFILSYLKKKKPKYCLDIGANTGSYSNILLNNTDAKVIAFEPQKNCNIQLKRIKKKFKKRFKFYNVTLGEQSKKIYFNYSKNKSELASASNYLSKISYIDQKKFKRKLVKIHTLDNFFWKLLKKELGSSRIDFIKIDTEGFELEILKGAKKIFKEFQPKLIQVELNWHHLFKGHNLWIIYEYLSQLSNYRVYKILPNSNKLIEIDPSKPEHNLFNYSNYIFKNTNV